MPDNHLRVSRKLIVLLFLLAACLCQAQSQKFRVSGILIDSAERKTISFVTVNLYKSGQLVQPIKSTYTDAKGKFQFSSVDTGRFVLIFTHTGFIEKRKPIAVNAAMDLGELEISRLAVTMKGVSVVGQKPMIEQQDDKVIFNVENDPDSKTSLTLDILRKTPFLSVDGDDNVLMNGKSDFKVLLNGRETSMFARNIKEALRAFPGTLISRIEVITTPPAKYDAEGIGGIINIITKKKVGGYNGSLSTFNRTGARQNNFNGNLNIKSGKMGIALFGYVSGFENMRTRASAITLAKTPGLYTQRSVFDNTINNNIYGGGGAEISWELDSMNTLTAYGEFEGSHNKNWTNRTITTDFPSSASTTSTQDIYNLSSNPGFDVGADYIKKYSKHKDKEFSIRAYAEFGRNKSTDDSKQYNPGTDRFLLNHSNNIDNQYTIQSDLILPLPKNQRLESGIKLILRKASSDFQSSVKYDPMLDFKVDPNNSDYFKYTQDIISAYSTYTIRNKKSTYRIGARVEYTAVDGDFVSSNTTVRQRYANLVPFLQFVTKLNPKYTMVLTYNQRLSRPYIWNLNPFVNNIDSLDITYGNPKLGSVTIRNFSPELRFQKGPNFASINAYLAQTNNNILEYATFDPATGVTKRTSDHLGHGWVYRLNLSFNSAINPKLNLNMNTFIAEVINRVKTHPEYNSDGFGYGFNTGFNYKITPKISWAGNFSLNKNSGLIQYKYPLNIWYVTMLAFKLFQDKVNMSIRTTNFLKYEREFKFVAEDQWFQTTRLSSRPVRGIVITFNWNFGKLKEDVSKKKGVSNDDLISTPQPQANN